jgi:putative addiction module component (TIGR02574 family)
MSYDDYLVSKMCPCDDRAMLPDTLAKLLRLPADERVELAMALWDSLSDSEREAELALTPAQEAELDRRVAEHISNPGSAIPWEEVRRKLTDGT